MATGQNPLFSWDAVDRLPDLERLQLILEVLSDAALLEARLGRGRNGL